MAPYKEEFPAGSKVRIASLKDLHEFKSSWKYHHPLQEEQLNFADAIATVTGVSFYHGGDALYQLHEAPGTWHEICLRAVTDR